MNGMTRFVIKALLPGLLAGCIGCRQAAKTPGGSFGNDLDFLAEHTPILVLSDSEAMAQVVVAPEYQGRVMTSTTAGREGASFGWINRDAIASGVRKPHINVFGGEDRFWLGPEGGQFSIFFSQDSPFDLEHWQTPEPIDWGAWEVIEESPGEIHFQRDMRLANYSGTEFQLRADRIVRLVSPAGVSEGLGVPLGTLRSVAFESENRITNTGDTPWTREGGLLSIWILGMFKPSEDATIVIPFQPGPESELGPAVNDAYFGKVPNDRLKVKEGILFFSGDGNYRSKIGIGPNRARPILGSYAAKGEVLTLVQFTLPEDPADYVNSMWEIQEYPYRGDVVNSYNDGPPEPGADPLGPFYELETSSPAAALGPGETLVHLHRTAHFQGAESELDRLARATLGAGLEEIASALPH